MAAGADAMRWKLHIHPFAVPRGVPEDIVPFRRLLKVNKVAVLNNSPLDVPSVLLQNKHRLF